MDAENIQKEEVYLNSQGLPDVPVEFQLGADGLPNWHKTSLLPPRKKYARSAEIYNEKIRPHLDLILNWRMDGETIESIAKKLGISRSHLDYYKNTNPDLNNILAYGRDKAIGAVERSLYGAAVKHKLKEEHWKSIIIDDPRDPDNGKTLSVQLVNTIIKEVDPIANLNMYILNNREPGKWNRREQVVISGELSFSNLLNKVREVSAQERMGLDPAKEVALMEQEG